MIRSAGAENPQQARIALGVLIETYWYPLYAFARHRGHSDHDAMDLTQGFFAHLLAGDGLGSVSQGKGRFRSFLLASFSNFIANQIRAATTQRRHGPTMSLSAPDFETRYDRGPADHRTPEALFQRSWIESLLSLVRKRLADEYRAAGKSDIYLALEPHMTHAVDALPRAQISQQLKLSPAAVTMSLYRMRRRYGELLREEIAATVDDPAEVEDELRELIGSLGKAD
jgi:RNA polymerase sigma factor (sigma-70 family)